MTWEEQKIRDVIPRMHASAGISPEFSVLSVRDSMMLLTELDKARAALEQVKAEAQKHMDDRLRGWERWQKVYDWTKDALK